MTHADLTELQIEISELEKENQDLKNRVKDLEINFTYVSKQIESDESQNAKCGTEKMTTNEFMVH